MKLESWDFREGGHMEPAHLLDFCEKKWLEEQTHKRKRFREVMHEELDDVRGVPDRTDAERADRWTGSHPLHHAGETVALELAGHQRLRVALETAAEQDSRPRSWITFADDEMRCEVRRGPVTAEGRRIRPHLVEQVAQLTAFAQVQIGGHGTP